MRARGDLSGQTRRVIDSVVCSRRPLNARELAEGASSVVDVVKDKKEINIRTEKGPSEPYVFDQVSEVQQVKRSPGL